MKKFSKNNIIAFLIYCLIGSSACAQNENANYLKQFSDIFDKVSKEYVQEPDKQKMIDAALNGMLTSLDPHSYYFTDEELTEFLSQTEGQFGGIGVEIIYEDGAIKIIAPIEDLPADKAGIKAGDYIVSVDDELVKNLGFNKAIKKMRGDPGTKVKIKVVREGLNIPLDLEITREIVKIKAVKFKNDNNIAYIRITTFNKNTIDELKTAFNEITKSSPKLEGIILDLRNNPGGLMDQAIKVTDYFIDSGTIVSTRGRNPANNLISSANIFSTKAPKLNIVVLINSGSASASEIVAGALQDHGRGIIMGTKSFGKGSVQNFVELNARAGMKITTAKYYTPKGRCIQAEGIEPDIKVETAKVEYASPEDEDKKIFEKSYKNHLKGVNEDNKESSGKKSGLEKAKTLQQLEPKSSKEELSDLYKKDYQYARAFDLLKSLNIISSKAAKP
jgi:carboxyl-terminal processing protease